MSSFEWPLRTGFTVIETLLYYRQPNLSQDRMGKYSDSEEEKKKRKKKKKKRSRSVVVFVCLFVCFVALRPKSTAMVMAGWSVDLT